MSAVTVTTTLTNGHVPNGKLETELNGYRKNGYVKKELESPVSKETTINFYHNLKAISRLCVEQRPHLTR